MTPAATTAAPSTAFAAVGADVPTWVNDELRRVAARAMAWFWIGLGALLLLLSIGQWIAGGGDPLLAQRRGALGAVLSVVGGAAWWLQALGRRREALLLVSAGSALIVFGYAWLTGLGVHNLIVAGYAIVLVLAGATLGPIAAAALLAAFVVAVCLLAWAESAGLIAAQQALASLDPRNRLLGLIVIGTAAWSAALMIHRVLARALHDAGVEQQRLTALLRIGSDWTWRLDGTGRLVELSPSFEAQTGLRMAEFMRLDEPGAPAVLRDADWTRLQSELRARRPFRDLPLTYRLADGGELHVRSSGEPLCDAQGRFLGWWGMSRNVTREVLAERATLSERDMVQRLFELSPDPILLVELVQGRILRANPSFCAGLGRTEQEVIGRNGRHLGLWKQVDDDLRLQAALREGDGRLRNWPTTLLLRGLERRALLSAAAFERNGQPVAMLIVHDVTEAERSRAELAAARQEAEAASHAKSAFLATMSHEIRTPLNGVLGLARLLQDERDERRRGDYLQHLVGAAEGLAGLVSDVLDLSKIEAGRVVLEDVGFDLRELLQGTFNTFAPLGRERGLAMDCRIDPGVHRRVRGDPVRVRQIVSNYLNNALKFTPRGRIVLACSLEPDGAVRVAVTDSGIGIDAPVRDRLFRPFSQADSSTTRRFGGTGLGLSICRELAQLMGGRVGADSEPGRGSTFWATLPLAACERSPDDVALDDATAALPLTGLTVLVAEDNPVNMLIVRTLLERLGAQVMEAADGAQAVALAAQAMPALDAVLMDLHMPVQDGLEAARTLRARYTAASLPLIALSAAVLEQERAQARQAGLDEFLHKPVSQSDLLRVLAPLVRRRRANV